MRKCLSLVLVVVFLVWPGPVSIWAAQPPAAAAQAPPAAAPSPQVPQAPAPATASQAPAQAGQAPGGAVNVCGQVVRAPANTPPAGSGPVVYLVAACFPTQGNVSVIDAQTYRYYIQLQPSRPSASVWVPWDDKAEKAALDDFKRLWSTKLLDNLWVDVNDYTFSNGVTGKIVVYNMEERQRVKIVDYVGSKKLEQTKIDDKLKEENAQIRLDTFIDEGLIRKVQGIVKDLLAEKGFEYATVTHTVKEMPGGPKLVHLTFNIDEGPKVRIQKIQFVGNKAASTSALERQMKANKAQWNKTAWGVGWLLAALTGRGTYQESKFEDDADKILEYYRNNGYVGARVGEPELKTYTDSTDRTTRWVQLRIPVQEGPRYRVGEFTFDGNKVVKTEALRALFKLKAGDWYSEKAIRKGLEKAREIYGTVGYFEFTGYPDLQIPDEQKPAGQPATEAPGAPGETPGPSVGADQEQAAPAAAQPAPAGNPPARNPQAKGQAASPAAARKPAAVKRAGGPPLVNVIMRLQEGKQYFVNRITFQGNTTTRDSVVRREMRLVEGGVFNTEALKYSIKRINQLGYFKNIEGDKEIKVDKTPGADNKVDVTLKVEEQNRNQLTFGAGVSQFEGFFGQLGFQTANFMGRGETFSVNIQAGSRAQNYQVGFTEPFLFDRNITGGVDLFKREIRYINQFTESSTGGNIVLGLPVKDFTRFFLNYSYERTGVKDINQVYTDPLVLQSNPYLADSLLVNSGGTRTISKIVPSLIANTVDQPIFPTTGHRYSLSVDLAGLGGDTNFWKPVAEAVWYLKQNNRLTLGLRAQAAYINQLSGNKPLPIFEKLYLGGEYSIRGFDIRSIGPKAAPVTVYPSYNGLYLIPALVPGEIAIAPMTSQSDLVVGGNKSLLFNAEYNITIAGPVRLILFADAGQVQDTGQHFTWNDFKTSTGAEVRFFMPVLNVPFRLIFAYNPNRSGVLDNNFEPQKAFSFRFAVGSTF